MGTNKTCKIFLASSIDEMRQQRLEFGDFIRNLSDIYRPRGVDITMTKCEDLRLAYTGRPTEDVLHDAVRNSDVLVALFYKKCGDYTVQEFDVACESLATNQKPIVIVAIKNAKNRTPELESFMKKVDDDLGIFHWRFGNKEKLHFDFVMWFLQSEFAVGDLLTVENGAVKVGDLTIAQLSQLPFAANNAEYQRLEDSLKSLNEDIEQLTQNILKYPDDTEFPKTLSKKVMEREKVQEELKRQQESLLGAAKRIAQIEKENVSKKLQEAIDAFEAGQLERANTLLDQIANEAEGHVEQLDQNRDLVHQDIEVLLLQTQTVMAEAEKTIGERIARVADIYAKADDWATRSAYDKEKYAQLLSDYANFYYNYGFYNKGIQIYLRQIALSEELYGKDSVNTATSYNNIGTVYSNKGIYDKALEYYFKALDIRKKVLGTDHPDTAGSYSNIGTVYHKQGDYDKALEYYFKALVIREKDLGIDHPDTSTTYNNIGAVYDVQGDYDQALEYHIKALDIVRKVLGEEHPNTAPFYNNIGSVYHKQGNYGQALEYYFKALDIRKKVLGTDHPDTAGSYNNIGSVYFNQGDSEKALEYYFKALDIFNKVLGDEHPNTATSYNNIGTVYDDQDNYDEALEYHFKALAIREKVLGTEHPETASSYNNIGLVYWQQGDYDQALECYFKALDIVRKVFGENHPYTAIIYNNIGLLYKEHGDYDKAWEYLRKAEEIKKKRSE